MASVLRFTTLHHTTPHNHHHIQLHQTNQKKKKKTDKAMSRSAADATRFTATGPYANARPHGPAYKLPSFMKNTTAQSTPGGAPGQHPGPGQEETPRQKVERLRAQARAARVAQGSSRVDRVIDVGREVANRAHKVMVYSLIAASGISLPEFHPLLSLSFPGGGG